MGVVAAMMHTYRKVTIPGKHVTGEKFEVGYWRPPLSLTHVGDWITLSTHIAERLAVKRVNILNGGDGNPSIWSDI